MKTSFTRTMLSAISLAAFTTISAVSTPEMPRYLHETPRFETSAKFKSAPSDAKHANEAEETCAVLIQLPEDLQGWSPDICVACTPGQPVINPSGDYLNLKPGTYDIVARFVHSNVMSFTFYDYNGYIVLENVEVNGDMSIYLDPTTITNHIVFTPLLPDGSELELPVVNIDENGNEVPVSDGSMPFGSMTILDYISGPGWGIDSSTGMSALINAETPWGFYDPTLLFGIHINDVSERINLGMGVWIGTPEYDMAYTLFMLGEQAGSTSGTVSNDPAAYKVRNFDPAWTPAGTETNQLIDQYPSDLGYVNPYGYAIRRVSGEYNRLSSGSIMTESKNPEIYSMAFSRNSVTNPQIHLLVAPTKTELVKIGSEVTMTTNYGSWLQPFEDGEWIVYPQTAMAQTIASPEAFFPFEGVQSFATPMSENEDVLFKTAPSITARVLRGFNPFGNTEYLGTDIIATGRMGETRNTDLSVMDAELRVNGIKVANSISAINEWLKGFEADMGGVTELKLTDNNFEIDGITGSTISTSHFDMTNDDFFPPSISMMQVRSYDGKLSSQIPQNASNRILIGAGDFGSSQEAINYYGQTATTTTEPSSMAIWYAPNGTEEWTELDYEKINDEVIDGIGNIYEAIISEGECGWKDLKIRVEDEAGNWMEQVIALAFKIMENTGVNEFKTDSPISVIGNEIIAPKDAEIWTVAGTRSGRNNLASGIYLVRFDGKTYKIAVN